MKKRAIITGATGFIGSHLVRALLSLDWDIALIVRPESVIHKLKAISFKAKIFIFNENPAELIDFFENFKPDVVFHLASCFLVDHEVSNIKDIVNSNILFGTYLLEAMLKANCKKIINTGSTWQHFDDEKNNPANLYAASKNAYVEILNYYYHAYGFEIISLELFDTYGPHDSRRKIVNLLIHSVSNNIQIDLSPGLQKINFVYIDDIVEAYLVSAKCLLERDQKSFDVYTVGGNEVLTLKEVVKTIELVSNKKCAASFSKRPYRTREVMKPWSKGKQLPNWEAKVNFKTGILNILKADKEET